MTALGKKVCPVACGDELRRLIGGTLCREYHAGLEDFFELLGRCGVSVRAGVELVAEQAMLGHQRGCFISSHDGVNVYNSVRRSQILPALAEYVFSVAGYAVNSLCQDNARATFQYGGRASPSCLATHISRTWMQLRAFTLQHSRDRATPRVQTQPTRRLSDDLRIH